MQGGKLSIPLFFSLNCLLRRDEANFNARQANAKYAEAQEKSEAWLKAKGEAQEHKGRWSEYWNQAKVGSRVVDWLPE